MRILHITYWYPNRYNEHAGIFVKEHVDALNRYCDNQVLHIGTHRKTKSLYRIERNQISDYERSVIASSYLFKYYRIEEYIVWRLLKREFESNRYFQNFDLINFHVAPPLLNHFEQIRQYVKTPTAITEHYTGYHNFFGLPHNSSKLNRIKNIFFQEHQLLTVSHALGEDIQRFSGNHNLNYQVVPNVINKELFHYTPELKSKNLSFFMITNWSVKKNPFVVIQAFAKVLKQYPEAELSIGGTGLLLDEMEALTVQLGIIDHVKFLGRISKSEVARQMNQAHVFLHGSIYDTFSVVSAEAICCGTPVVVSNIPAILEFVNESNGVAVERDTVDEWTNKILLIVSRLDQFDNEQISNQALNKFSSERVGKRYFEIIENVMSNQ